MSPPALQTLPVASSRAWWVDLQERFWRYLLLKLVGISAFMWIFFIGYFQTLRQPAFAVVEMPVTAIDAWIPFEPTALLAYFSLWIYVGVAPGLLLRVRELIVYGLWTASLCASGLLIFYFFPTSVPRPSVDVSAYAGFALLQGLDASGNACPSLHVATAVFTAIWVERLLCIVAAPIPLRVLNCAWVLAIAWSTVAVRQHVVLDVLAGAVLGTLFAYLSIRLSPWVGRRPTH
jgi:membrane-associated phospholipid phosphatase